MILSATAGHARAINSAVFPNAQGGPMEHTIAAKAVAFGEAMTEEFVQYQRQVRANAVALADTLAGWRSAARSGRHRQPHDTRRSQTPRRHRTPGRRGARTGKHRRQPQRNPLRSQAPQDSQRRPARNTRHHQPRLQGRRHPPRRSAHPRSPPERRQRVHPVPHPRPGHRNDQVLPYPRHRLLNPNSNMKVVTADQMRQIEARSEAAGVSTDTLMENAGLAVARAARRIIGPLTGVPILVLVGPGNNGADGLVTARHLQRWGACVTAYICRERSIPDPKLDAAAAARIGIVSASDDPAYSMTESHTRHRASRYRRHTRNRTRETNRGRVQRNTSRPE